MYTGPAFWKLNKAVAQNDEWALEKLAPFAAALEAGLPERTATGNFLLYRGTKIDETQLRVFQHAAETGETLNAVNFASTSTDIRTAERFTKGWGALLVLEVRRGTRVAGRDVSGMSCFPSEKEVLLSRNTKLVIDAVDTTGPINRIRAHIRTPEEAEAENKGSGGGGGSRGGLHREHTNVVLAPMIPFARP